jgi:hypothetical protein
MPPPGSDALPPLLAEALPPLLAQATPLAGAASNRVDVRFSVTSAAASARKSHLLQDMLFTIRGFSPSDIVSPGPVDFREDGLAAGQVRISTPLQPPSSHLAITEAPNTPDTQVRERVPY